MVTDALNMPIDCSNLFVGTQAELSDVILEGDLTAEYIAPRTKFPIRDSHQFYIRGTVRLAENPIVYSVGEDGKQLIAFTSVENSRNLVKVDVRYEYSCETEIELMKMEINTEECGVFMPQWIVDCNKDVQANPYDLLNIRTDKGEVITSEE